MALHAESEGAEALPHTLLLRPSDVAALLRTSTRNIARLRETGELPTVYLGHSPRIRMTDLHAYIDGLPCEPPTEREDANGA